MGGQEFSFFRFLILFSMSSNPLLSRTSNFSMSSVLFLGVPQNLPNLQVAGSTIAAQGWTVNHHQVVSKLHCIEFILHIHYYDNWW